MAEGAELGSSRQVEEFSSRVNNSFPLCISRKTTRRCRQPPDGYPDPGLRLLYPELGEIALLPEGLKHSHGNG